MFTKCMDAALAPLRLQGIRELNYLDDWLILAHSRELVSYHRYIVLHHIRSLGLRTNTKKSILTSSRQTVFLGVHLDSVQMQARLALARISSFIGIPMKYQLLPAVVFHRNRQGGSRSRTLNRLARCLLLWSQNKFLSLIAVHVPCVLNLAADFLSRQKLRPGESMLNRQRVVPSEDYRGLYSVRE